MRILFLFDTVTTEVTTGSFSSRFQCSHQKCIPLLLNPCVAHKSENFGLHTTKIPTFKWILFLREMIVH